MYAFLPRARRITTDQPVTLLLETGRGKSLTEPLEAMLCNISETGCCVEVETPMVSGHHLFYETLNSELLSLLLQGLTPAEHPSLFAVTAFSIWMAGVEEERPPGFRIGLQFRERQPWLFSQFKR